MVGELVYMAERTTVEQGIVQNALYEMEDGSFNLLEFVWTGGGTDRLPDNISVDTLSKAAAWEWRAANPSHEYSES
jgi:hypothetical protein